MFEWLRKKVEIQEKVKPIIGIEFYNREAAKLILWIELSCIELELEPATEYRIESDETEYRLEFAGDYVTLYLQYQFGPKVLKRLYSPDFDYARPWQIEVDYSDIK